MASIIKVDTIQDQDGNNIISEAANTITIGASGDTITIPSGATLANSGIVTGFQSTGIDDNATSTAITIDSSENVGIGTTSPASIGANITTLEITGGSTIRQGGIYLSNSDKSVKTYFYGTNALTVLATESNIPLAFLTNNTERMRIDSSGNVLVGKTSINAAVPGIEFRQTDIAIFTRDSDTPVLINRTTNDGGLVEFEAQNTLEGTITVSGSTVAYNGFTGTHWSRFIDNSTPNILKGTVLESLDEMCDWYNLEFETTDEEGNTSTQKIPYVLQDGQSDSDVITYNHEGTNVQATIVKETDIKHVKSKVSDTVDAKNVYGVFMAYDEDGEGYNDFYVASVGSFVVRIKQGETIAKGDLLQSNGDGTAKVQTDDNVKSSSFAKVLSTTVIETYEDGSFLVPCSLMC